MKRVSPDGRAGIESEEGYVGHWYDLHDGAGAYGQTGGFGHVRRAGDPETFDRPMADAWLTGDLRVVEGCLNAHLPEDIGQNAFDACASLCYNIGVGGFASSSVLKFIRAGDMQCAADAFRLWDKATIRGIKQVDAVLVGRRERERARFLRDVP